MSEILAKFKRGVSGTGAKVKGLVDVSKLKIRVAQKEDLIEEEYKQIGKLVYQNWRKSGSPQEQEAGVAEICQRINGVREEIDELNNRINEAKGIKECSCGELVSLETKFCPECGRKIEGDVAKTTP